MKRRNQDVLHATRRYIPLNFAVVKQIALKGDSAALLDYLPPLLAPCAGNGCGLSIRQAQI